jgi:hypothetical protein
MMLIPKIGKPQAEVEGYRGLDSELTCWGKNARTTKVNEVNVNNEVVCLRYP